MSKNKLDLSIVYGIMCPRCGALYTEVVSKKKTPKKGGDKNALKNKHHEKIAR